MNETEVKTAAAMEESARIDLDDLMRKYDTESRFRILAGWQEMCIRDRDCKGKNGYLFDVF